LYVEDLKRGTNKDIGPKDIFELGSKFYNSLTSGQQFSPGAVVEWLENQQIAKYIHISDRRVEIDTRLRQVPRGTAGLENPKSKMAFRVCFYPDRLKTFIMKSSFLERFDPGLGKIDHFMESDTGF